MAGGGLGPLGTRADGPKSQELPELTKEVPGLPGYVTVGNYRLAVELAS